MSKAEPIHVQCKDCMNNTRDGQDVCRRYRKPCAMIRDFCTKTRYYYQMCVLKGLVAEEAKKARGG